MNEKTLLSFIVDSVKKSKTIKDDFTAIFLHHFFNFMKSMEFPMSKMGQMMDDYQDAQFCKTDSRQALGNLNDLAFLYEHMIYDQGSLESCDVSDIYLEDGSYVVEIPFSNPKELMLEILRLGPDVFVLEPPSLRQAVKERLAAAASQYE